MMFCVRQIPGEDLGKDADRPAQPVSASSTSSALSYAATEIGSAYEDSQGSTCSTLTPPSLDYEIGRGPTGGAYRLSSAKVAAAAAAGKAAAAAALFSPGKRGVACAVLPDASMPRAPKAVLGHQVSVTAMEEEDESNWLDSGEALLEDVDRLSHEEHADEKDDERGDSVGDDGDVDDGDDRIAEPDDVSDQGVESTYDGYDLGPMSEPLDCLQDPGSCDVYWNEKEEA